MNDATSGQFAEDLEQQARRVLEHAVDAHRNGLKVYESLQNLNEVIGTEYGDRVLYELIQNAHDAHEPGDNGRIAIRLVIRSDSDGELYIANDGNGFRKKDVEAIRNLAISAKEIGEGIGNKGLGFRSVETLTNDVRIFSQKGKKKFNRFNGYCFRFASASEIEAILLSDDVDATTCSEVARTIPRYLVPRSLNEQPEEVISYARRRYATVVVLPLRTVEAVSLACKQVTELADLDVPLLLFLDRIVEVRIDVERSNQRPDRRRLRRRQTKLTDIPKLQCGAIYEVNVGRDRKFLVVCSKVDQERIRVAVESSISSVPQIKRWLDWKGQPEVSVAVGLSPAMVTNGRLYNFLPMGEEAYAPLIGYLDAPFFTDINRRSADLELPLNRTLMEVAAEICAAAVLFIVEQGLPIASQAVFDLFAWTGKHSGKFDNALREIGSRLCDVPVIPVIAERGRKEWANLSQVSIWPEGDFSVLKDKSIARHVGVRLISKDLDAQRVKCLREIARSKFLSLTPTSEQLAEWSESFACSLLNREAAVRIWSGFYNDLPRVFDASGARLESLKGRKIFLDRSRKLRPAGGHDRAGRVSVYVRRNIPKGKRKIAGVPLPPATLARRYCFLDKRITLKRETLDTFIKADLVREYGSIEALDGLKSVLGKSTNISRRREALHWAFQVWHVLGRRVDDVLQRAELHVPTISGWQPANRTTFSSSWTLTGKTLKTYLEGTADISPDCLQARNLMLVEKQDWPISIQGTERDWIHFLRLIGVTDGLRPIPSHMTREGSPSKVWNAVLRYGIFAEGLDKDWCHAVSDVSFRYLYTEDYMMKKEAWRLPGQIEYEIFPEITRYIFCDLIFEHLKEHGTYYFQFEVGRWKQYPSKCDKQVLPTPLATFLRSKAWVNASTQDGNAFKIPGQCWASRIRRGGPPRFMDRVPASVATFSAGTELAELVFSEDIGLRDWHSQETAVARLRDLAGIAKKLTLNQRPMARNEYQRAWCDVVESGVSLPSDLELIVVQRGRLEILYGTPEEPAGIIVAEDAQRFEAWILSASDQPVLEVGVAPTEQIVTSYSKKPALSYHAFWTTWM